MELNDFKTGDIILFHTPIKWYNPLTWVTPIIRFLTKNYYNHVGVVVSNWEVPFINEAIETGVITIPLKDRLNGKDIKVLRHESGLIKSEKEFAVKANGKLGHTGYDFSGLLFYQLIFQLTGCWLGHTGKHAEDRMYCGEYVAWNYEHIFEKYWLTAPSDIDNSREFSTMFKGVYKVLT